MDKKKTDFSVVYFILALGLMFVAAPARQTGRNDHLQPVQGPGQEGQVAEVVVANETIGGTIKSEGLKEIFSADKLKELGDGAKKPVAIYGRAG